MSNLTHPGGVLFQWILQTTWQAAVLAGLILLAQCLLRKRLSPSWRYGLWLLLVVRLLMPASPHSAFSIFNLARTTPAPLVAASPPPAAPAVASNESARSFPPNLHVVAEPREVPLIVQAPAVARPAANLDWFAVAFCGWLAGVCFFGARLVWSNGRFRSRIGGYQPVADEAVTRLFNDCRAAFKITRPVRLIESEEVESPAVYGLWRKWLLLPDGVFERFSTGELRCIFLHELAHVKRGDLGVNWLVALLQVLHWFNPFLWLAWARMRADRELATDALALRHVDGSDHASYGETILKVLEGLTGERALPGLVGIVESKARIKERLTAIGRPGKYWKWAALTVAVLIAGLGLTGAQTGEGRSSETRADLTGSLTLTDGQPVKAPPILLGRRGRGQSGFPPIKSSLRGIVLLPDGKPAADAQVGLKIPQQNLNVGDGELVAGPMNDSVVRTEADGSFTVPMRDTATALYALNEAGFAKVPSDSWTNGVKIILQPWGRVEGVLRLNNRLAPDKKVEISEDHDFGTQFTEGGFSVTTTTDEQGRFVFAHVPAGNQQLCRQIPYGNNGWMTGNPTFVSVRSGGTTNLILGGKGRPVLGKCVVENLKDVPEDPIFMVSIHALYPTALGTKTNAIQLTSAQQRQEQRRTLSGQSFRATAAADGSFQVDDVVPGTYQIQFTIEGGGQSLRDMTRLNSQPKQIVVPALSDPEKCEPVELGVLKTSFTIQKSPFRQPQANSHSLKPGDSAPAFETKALSGRPLRLQDYKGKFVLLDFRFMLPSGEMEGLQSVNNTFGADDRFVIISLCQTADEDFLKNLSAKGATHWMQGNLDFDAMAGPYGLNAASFPLIMLVDPKGKIVATGLHGDDIQSTVATALAKK